MSWKQLSNRFWILKIGSIRCMVTCTSIFECLRKYFAVHYPFIFKRETTLRRTYARMSFYPTYTPHLPTPDTIGELILAIITEAKIQSVRRFVLECLTSNRKVGLTGVSRVSFCPFFLSWKPREPSLYLIESHRGRGRQNLPALNAKVLGSKYFTELSNGLFKMFHSTTCISEFELCT